ncbi:LysR family transcriptional regulator [Microbacterium sp.]|uniref:LysR family transcriptional regulator n=1 Tax=Microbacterium sp. TaxID=51671 RepID=UPI003A8BC0AB
MDLNLLRVFVAIYETRNLTRTAESLHVTQPAVSQALQRLRRGIGDELFVRSGREMTPTLHSTQIYPDVRAALARIANAVSAIRDFDASTTALEFRFALSELGETTYLPPITAAIRSAAPHARIRVIPLVDGQSADLLESGSTDILISSTPALAGRESTVLKSESYVVMMNARHPLAESGALTLETYSAASHASVSGDTARPSLDVALNSLSRPPRVVLVHTRFAALPHVLQSTDLLATVPASVAAAWVESWPLVVRPLPLDLPPVPVRLYLRNAGDDDAHLRWLRDATLEAIHGVSDPNIAVVPSRWSLG